MEASEVRTHAETVEDAIAEVTKWAATTAIDIYEEGFGCSLCSNFVTIGLGHLSIRDDVLYWAGNLVNQAERVTLVWKRAVLSDIRWKQPSDAEFIVLVTVGETKFLQFSLASGNQN